MLVILEQKEEKWIVLLLGPIIEDRTIRSSILKTYVLKFIVEFNGRSTESFYVSRATLLVGFATCEKCH